MEFIVKIFYFSLGILTVLSSNIICNLIWILFMCIYYIFPKIYYFLLLFFLKKVTNNSMDMLIHSKAIL